jgi:hypothetical protein
MLFPLECYLQNYHYCPAILNANRRLNTKNQIASYRLVVFFLNGVLKTSGTAFLTVFGFLAAVALGFVGLATACLAAAAGVTFLGVSFALTDRVASRSISHFAIAGANSF